MKHRGLPERTARQILLLVIAACCLLHFVFVSAFATPPLPAERRHFDGVKYFNPDTGPEGRPSTGRFLRWVGRWLFGADWTPWPDPVTLPPVTTAKPPKRVREGIVITVVGHATFLIQMDGLNLLMDPMWSDRCSPLSWIGPRRHQPPGIRLEDLPPLDGILITHNHYDHLDLPTLRHLALHRPARVLVPLGNGALIRTAGLRDVQELDWWDKVRFSPTVEVTLVPARHFSARGLWDRDRSLWGGFVVAGPSGRVYGAGDTGYGSHFSQIGQRFSPLQVALLPIAPYIPPRLRGTDYRPSHMHLGPREALEAHRELKPCLSIAAHFQVFQLGPDGFDEAVEELKAARKDYGNGDLRFLIPRPGDVIKVTPCQPSPDAVVTRSRENGRRQ